MSLPETLDSNHNITHGGPFKTRKRHRNHILCLEEDSGEAGRINLRDATSHNRSPNEFYKRAGCLAGFRTGSLPKSPWLLSLFAQMCSAGQGYKPGEVVSGPFCPLQADRGRLSCSSHPCSAGTNGDSHFLSPFGSVFNNLLLVHFMFCLP